MADRNVKTFGEYIKTLRESTGCPQRKIAAQLDIDPSLLGKFERNERQPTRIQIQKMAEIFGQDEEILLQECLSDQIAYKVLEAFEGVEVLKVAERKILYFKKKKNV